MDSELSVYEVLLNVPNLKVEQVAISSKQLDIYCKMVLDIGQVCPSCKCKNTLKTPKYRRKVRDLDISGRHVYLYLQVHQYLCECGRRYIESFDFVEGGKSYTQRQAKWIFELIAQQSHTQVGSLVDISHKTVERICYAQIEERHIEWEKIRRIGIDEFAIFLMAF